MKSGGRWVLALGILLGLVMTGMATSAGDFSVGDYTLVTSKRVSLYEYDYTYKASLTNNGPAVTGVKAKVVSSSPYIKVMEDELDFGDVASGATVKSIDTGILRHDRRGPFDTTKLTWTVNAAPVMVVVPDVTGQTEETARSVLQTSGLEVGNVATAYNDGIAAGMVVSQVPTAGNSVAPGTTVELTVSLGPELVSVPNVIGMNQADATAALLAADCILGSVDTTASDTVPAGQVLSQNPSAGTLTTPGSAVSLVLSSGPAPEPTEVTIPDVTGLTQTAAEEVLKAKGYQLGSVTTINSSTAIVGNVVSQDPAAEVAADEGTAVAVVISLGPALASETVPELVGLSQSEAQSAISAAGFTVGTLGQDYSSSVPTGHVISQSPLPRAKAVSGSGVALIISLGPISTPPVPPDPADIAPPLDTTIAPTVAASTAFLYSGANPIQTGVPEGTIEVKRAAVLRGQVLDRDNQPLSGVNITIKDHPEFGQTFSRADGMFDLAVNGGGYLSINYQKEGFLPAQRQINAPWNDFAIVEDVVLITLDPEVTTVDLAGGAAIQVARGSQVTDDSGARQGILLVPQGTNAAMTLPDGTSQPLSTLNLRITEYTVGDNGPEAMPGPLPPTSGYTYAMELSADEALAAAASTVTFTKPLYYYVENFIGIPVGSQVPVGYYDAQKTAWVPSKDGRVIKIIGVNTGLAELDVTGTGTAASASDLANLGIIDAERQQLATLYSVGQSFWRVPINHFTSYDCNYGVGPQDPTSPDSPSQNPQNPEADSNQTLDEQNQQCGSILGCENQTLGEVVSISGTPFVLHYQSERTPGYLNGRTLDIPLSGAELPEFIKRIDLSVKVAGKKFTRSFSPTSNLSQIFTWDGTDAYGRRIESSQAAVSIAYIYDGYYQRPPDMNITFGQTGTSFPALISARQDVGLKQNYPVRLINSTNDTNAELGGWSFENHHFYNPNNKTLSLGHGGGALSQIINKNVITTVAGRTRGFSGDGGPATSAQLYYPFGITVAPDGSLYIADTDNDRIRRVGSDGIITTVAGNGIRGFSGDGGPATSAQLYSPYGMTVAPDGSLYIADSNNHRVRRVGPDGIITTAAGTAEIGFSGDGGLATSAKLRMPIDISVAPDGSLYIADTNNSRIRRVGPDGIITTVAGTGEIGFSGDDDPATSAQLWHPFSIAVGPGGGLFIADMGNHRIRRVDPFGIITTVAGNGTEGFSGDGGPATSAQLYTPYGMTVAPDGSLYLVTYDNRIRRVGQDGIITTVAGNGTRGFSGDGGLAMLAQLWRPFDISANPDGSLYIADMGNSRIRRISSTLPGLGIQTSDILIPSAEATEIYHFNSTGKHLRTLNALTGAPIYQFGYDTNGHLISVTDGNGRITTIERDAEGNPTAIVAPHGQRTTLALDENGYLAKITNPAGESHSMTYTSDGLMLSFADSKGNASTFAYDELGHLTKDADAAGGFKTLAMAERGSVKFNFLDTALGRQTIYTTENFSTGDQERTVTYPFGGVQTRTIGTNGTTTTTEPDGTIITTTEGPDPRFGMMAPVQSNQTIKTPSGLTSSTQQSRTVSFAETGNPLTSTSQTDTTTVNGRVYKTVFDAFSKKHTLTSAANRISEMTIDALGRPLTLLPDPAVLPSRFVYDKQGLLAETIQGSNKVKFGYDSLGRLDSVINALNLTTLYEHDAANRITKLTLPSTHAYGLTYDANGNRTGITMPNGAVHSLGYNNLNLLSSYTPPGNLPYFWEYNLDKELVKETLPSGREITHGYDNGGRPTSLSYPEATVIRQYAGDTTRVSEIVRSPADGGAAQTIAFSYDGWLVMSRVFSGVANGTFSYSYDNNFFLTNMTLQSGAESVSLPINRDADGLVTQIGSFVYTRSGPAGATKVINDGTMTVTIDYDDYGRARSRSHTVNGKAVYSIGLTYDDAGQIITRNEILNGSSIVNEYSYDVDGQLIQVKKGGAVEEDYDYDANGNRTLYKSGTSLNATAEYDAQDRLKTQGSIEYRFDDDGFLVKKGRDLYTYSSKGELLSANLDGLVITYAYDGTHRRVARNDPAGTIQYLYGNPGNPFQLTASRNPQGVLTIYYYDLENRLISFAREGAKYYVACDQVGSPRIITNAAGEKIKFIEYHSFGNVIYDSDPGFDLPIGFAGGLKDPTTGLIRFGFRDYDSWAGRWTAKDPVLFEGKDANLYRYVKNKPLFYLDPFGLEYVGPSSSGTGTTVSGQDPYIDSVSPILNVGGHVPIGAGSAYGYNWGTHPGGEFLFGNILADVGIYGGITGFHNLYNIKDCTTSNKGSVSVGVGFGRYFAVTFTARYGVLDEVTIGLGAGVNLIPALPIVIAVSGD